MSEKTMWFVSAHTPTEDQIKDAERMGYSLQAVKSPLISESDNVSTITGKWVELLGSIPIQPGDALVVMGEPRWIAAVVTAWTKDLCYEDGWMMPVIFENSEGKKIRMTQIELFTTFSERQSVEVHNPDSTVRKRSVFKHKKFVPLI